MVVDHLAIKTNLRILSKQIDEVLPQLKNIDSDMSSVLVRLETLNSKIKDYQKITEKGDNDASR